MFFSPSRLAAAALLALAPLAASHAADRFVAQAICDCRVTSLSTDGRVAVGRMRLGEAFRWSADGGLEPLSRNPYDKEVLLLDEAPGVSGDGRRVAGTIGDRRSPNAVQGLWTRAAGWQQPRAVPPDADAHEGVASVVTGISRDGKVVVGYYMRDTAEGGRQHASTWTAAGGLRDLGSEGGDSWLHAASADGTVLVGVDTHPVFLHHRAAVWSGGQRQWVDDGISWPFAVNAAGDAMVGGAVDETGEYAAALWHRQGDRWALRSLGRLEGASGYAIALGVSDDGQTVVGNAAWRDAIFDMRQTGFVWTEATGLVQAIDFFGGRLSGIGAGYRMEEVAAISGDGQVMGVIARRVDGKEPVYRSFLVRRQPAHAPR